MADAAAQGIVPVAVRLERPRDGVRDRPDLALAARPPHQRAGHRRRADDRGLGEGPRRPARAARRRLRSPHHRGAVGDALLRSRLAAGRRPSRRHRGLRRRALRRAAAEAGGGRHRAGAAVRRRCATTRGTTCPSSCAARDDRLPRLRRPRRLSGHHARPLRRDRAARRRRRARGPLWLVAQGWVHPTDSSINVAIGAGRARGARRACRCEVADAGGRFRDRAGGPRLPGGQGQDDAASISSGVFARRRAAAAAPRRRTSRSSGIAWAGRSGRPGRARRRRAGSSSPPPSSRIRGYSVTEQTDAERRPSGRATCSRARRRAGATSRATTRASATCRELLRAVDDRYVIMNAGDELRLRFPEAPPPAPGLVRDFVVVGDGWVKDGDYNTTFSRTVLPLPTHADAPLRRRRPGGSRTIPSTARTRRTSRSYHTRYVSPDVAARGARRARRARCSDETAVRPPRPRRGLRRCCWRRRS